MSDSEKSLKALSGIVSGLLVVSALIFFLFAWGKPKEAEAILEYSATPGFDPNGLTSQLQRLRKDPDFLVKVALRSKLAKPSDPGLTEIASKLGSRLSFDANPKEPTVSVRATHRSAATAIDVANAAATFVKESLDDQQRELAKQIISQADAEGDKRKMLAILYQREADPAAARLQDEENNWRCGIGYPLLIDAKADHQQALDKLEELKARPALSLGAIRAAKVTSD